MLRETTMQRLQSFGWILMAAVLLSAAPAAGQGPTGQVLGHVTDSEGAAVSGATVILQSQEIEEPLTATTDADGFYNATNVRPATYQVSVEATGYAGAPASLAVRVGSIQRVNFELAATEDVSEEITVVSERPQIESVDSRVNKYISFEEIQSLPLPNRSFLDVLRILPGVHGGLAVGALENSAPNNSFSVHGARMNQNQFLIDGVANNDLSDLNYDDRATSETRAGPRASAGAGQMGSTFSTGTALQTYNLDAIQEVQVSTSMFSAEYGNASGGVINIITRSGADQYNASATVQQAHDGLVEPGFVGTTVDDAEQLGGQDFTRRQASLTLGGPVKRGTTHFFASYEYDDLEMGYDYNQRSHYTRAVPAELGLTANVTNRDRLTGKLSHRFSDSNDLTVSANWVNEQAAVANSLFRTFLEDVEQQDHANESLGLSVRHVAAVGSDMTLESVLGQIQADRSMESSSDPLRQLRQWRDDGASAFSMKGAIGPEVDNTLESFQWKERLSWLRGDHSLRAGVGVERFGQRTEQPEWRYWFYGFVDDFSVPPASGIFQFATDIDVSVTSSHLFIQDDWFVNDRWTFNLGGRYDRNNLVDDQTVEARLGAAVDVGRNGRSVFRFGAGLYHDRTNLIGHTGADRPPLLSRVPIDPVTFEMDPTSPGSQPREIVVDPNLHLPEILKWTVGYERQLGERNTLSIHVVGSDSDGLFFTDRQNRESFELDGARADPTRGGVRVYTNTGYSEVLDVEVEFRRRFANGSLVHVSYTNQDAVGSSYFDLISGNSTLNRAARYADLDDPVALFNGPLNTEVEHSYKLSAVGNLPWGLQLSGFLDYRSGTPFTSRDSECLFSPGGYRACQSILFEGFNGRNAPDYFSADVRLAKTFTVRERHDLRVFLDVFNATDRTNVIEMDGLRSYNNSGRLGEPGTLSRDDWPRIRSRGQQRSAQFGIRWSM